MALELACRMGMVEHMIRYEYWNSGAAGIVIGLSGGVDSAVAAAFCCRAIGPEKVHWPLHALIREQQRGRTGCIRLL